MIYEFLCSSVVIEEEEAEKSLGIPCEKWWSRTAIDTDSILYAFENYGPDGGVKIVFGLDDDNGHRVIVKNSFLEMCNLWHDIYKEKALCLRVTTRNLDTGEEKESQILVNADKICSIFDSARNKENQCDIDFFGYDHPITIDMLYDTVKQAWLTATGKKCFTTIKKELV